MSVKTKDIKGSIVGPGSFLREGFFGFGCGMLYGTINPLFGHPFDTIKTKMQASAKYLNKNAFQTFYHILKTENILGLYRGFVFPFVGSSVYRSLQFGTYATVFSYLVNNNKFFNSNNKVTRKTNVIIASVFASLLRSTFETPLEMMKVKRQTKQSWILHNNTNLSRLAILRNIFSFRQLFHTYKGLSIVSLRNVCGITTFFLLLDYSLEKFPHIVNSPLIGPFFKGSVCGTLSWALFWPLEVIKNKYQASSCKGDTLISIVKSIFKEKNVTKNLYRGIAPGLLRTIVGNGVGMVAFTYCQRARKDRI